MQPRLEHLEDRTVPTAALTVNNLTVAGSNGVVAANSGTWFDDPGVTLGLAASIGP
jgi:hypothetical protein